MILYLNPEQVSLDEFYTISRQNHWYCAQVGGGDGFADYLFSLTHFYGDDPSLNLTQGAKLLVDLGEVIAANSISVITLPSAGSYELPLELRSGMPRLTWLNPGLLAASAVSVEINWVAMNPSVSWLNSCLEMQDHHFWKPRAALVYQGQETYSTEILPTYPYPFDRDTTLRSTRRCYSFSIPFTMLLDSPGPFKAGIDQVQIVNTDSGVVTTQDCATAKDTLEKSYPGLEIRCVTFQLRGESQNWFEVLSHPPAMSEQEAYTLVESAFIRTIAGPWFVKIRLE